MGSLGQGDFDAFVGDLDLGWGIQEMAEQLAGLRGFISGQSPAQHSIKSAGNFGQSDVEIDLQADRRTQRIQMKEFDGVGQPVLDQHPLRVAGDAWPPWCADRWSAEPWVPHAPSR